MRLLIFSILLWASTPSLADQPSLRFSLADSWSMPLVNVRDGQPNAGILFDIMQSLSEHMGRTAIYHVLPRNRIQGAMERGEIDVRCYVSPDWLGGLSGDYTWSLPLLIQRDLLVTTARNAFPITAAQLHRQPIGTVLGYFYPKLQPLFDSQQLIREDARGQDQVLLKLKARRYFYAVSSQWALDWFNQNDGAGDPMQAVAVINEEPVGCIARNDLDLPVQGIMRALLRMKMSGEIDRIIERYRTSSAPPALMAP
ncbi:ABC-type amino acid transport substrate-binding protein [Pseudomonas sp. JUb42]|jgi:ABC-type amino acid transport substrate-binding protein|uniref:substrate-binding periplasmic protein n=1 Tax=Pseudomonas sp. JUb42 TaxID=2940611 RepID=UPI0021694B67|nr:transporter substrate-binding domain-containing protein [Pseudomonas sp. JUb42]MCS3468157.1 ABC-type amino acid transport substrate-binding protein [Pseudomonas sp. JUb42]